jgi:hypothetical protein
MLVGKVARLQAMREGGLVPVDQQPHLPCFPHRLPRFRHNLFGWHSATLHDPERIDNDPTISSS